jgi:hypothetical protein
MADNTTHAMAMQSISRRNELTISDYICLQCIELKNQLKETKICLIIYRTFTTRIIYQNNLKSRWCYYKQLSHVATNQVINADWVEVSSRCCYAADRDEDKSLRQAPTKTNLQLTVSN